MKLEDAKKQFISTWGALGTNWGISKSMAQVHALLMVSDEPISAEDIMEQLGISRGNTNLSVRDLINWGLVYREIKVGERKEFFTAEKDIYKIGKQIIKIRREREVAPVIKLLNDLQKIDEKSAPAQNFSKQMKSIADFTKQADTFVGKVIDADENFFGKLLLKIIK